MPSTPEAIEAFHAARILFSPGKASNAGGVATSGLEMSQNSMRYGWTAAEVDAKLHMSCHFSSILDPRTWGPGNVFWGPRLGVQNLCVWCKVLVYWIRPSRLRCCFVIIKDSDARTCLWSHTDGDGYASMDTHFLYTPSCHHHRRRCRRRRLCQLLVHFG